MKAVVFKNIGQIALEDVSSPTIKEQKDAIIAITTSAICGTDLHLVRGAVAGMKPGTVLGHEAVGVIKSIGTDVHMFKVGDRVIVPSTIACGRCQYCEQKLYAQCDNSNPHGPHAGTAFYGGPADSGPFQGMQAEQVRVPFADVNLVKIPDNLTDEQVILLSDILPTSYMAVELADVKPSDTVAVFGCGPVGQLAVACLKIKGVKKIFAIDRVVDRLEQAASQGAHPINFEQVDPVKELMALTNNNGPSKVIDAVGVDAEKPSWCTKEESKQFEEEVHNVAPRTNPDGKNWIPGSGPSQALNWAVKSVAKCGTISIIGVYADESRSFLIGDAMNKNLVVRMGNCNHRAYFPQLLEWVLQKKINLVPFISHRVPLSAAVNAYKHFDVREKGWHKVILKVS
ncbi:glutathione-dependent formaldehyde dehydrogenase [Candidatus Dependentiae bacterium Noda2021]|nr:glutathione-dependent formaldehyde dehydrogenase [Candidatus Dependentiae bacterium Noda2021]